MDGADEPARVPEAGEHALRTVWQLAWPAVALNALQTVNSLLDSYFIQHLEESALTAIGAATTALWLLVSLSMAIGVAATAMVSRAYGEGNAEKYREANRKCLGFSVIGGLALTGLAIPLSWPTAGFLIPADSQRAIELMISYLALVAPVLPAMFVIQTLAGSLRGIGDTKSPMVISGIQILLPIVLKYFLIFPSRTVDVFGFAVWLPGADLRLAGAAWSLVISAWISAVIYLAWCIRTPLGEVWRIRLPGLDWARRIFRLAAPAALMSVVRVTSLMGFMAVLKLVPDGEIAIGSIRPGFSIEALAFMPSFGLAIAASALVGQSLGMRDPARASRLGWMAAHQAGIVSTVAAIIIFIFADPISSLLLPDKPDFAAMTASYLRHICATETLFGYAMVLVSAMQGAGDTRRPFWLTLICMWGIRVPLAAFLALPALNLYFVQFQHGLALGSRGCWMSMAITQAVQGIVAIWLWKRGRWAEAEV